VHRIADSLSRHPCAPSRWRQRTDTSLASLGVSVDTITSIQGADRPSQKPKTICVEATILPNAVQLLKFRPLALTIDSSDDYARVGYSSNDRC
jgi:hypothetical protein